MKSHIIVVLLAAACGVASAQTPPPQLSAKDCGIDSYARFMDMGFIEFDQTADAGWRALDRPGCEVAIAGLIKQYRETAIERAAGLYWHEGQGRAFGGQTEEALALFRRWLANELAEPPEHISPSNILKAEATIAFLENDRPKLLAARAELVGLPKPDGWDEAAAKVKERMPNVTLQWPANLGYVDNLIACFGKSYKAAVDCE